MTNNEDGVPERDTLGKWTAAERQELERMIHEGTAAFRERYTQWKIEKQESQHGHMPRQT